MHSIPLPSSSIALHGATNEAKIGSIPKHAAGTQHTANVGALCQGDIKADSQSLANHLLHGFGSRCGTHVAGQPAQGRAASCSLASCRSGLLLLLQPALVLAQFTQALHQHKLG